MSRQVDLHRVADRDLDEAAEYIRQDRPRSARGFMRQARATMEQLLALPEMGALYEGAALGLAGLRVFPVSRFRNYLIFYRPTDTGIEVLRVLHGARDIPRALGLGGTDTGKQPETDE